MKRKTENYNIFLFLKTVSSIFKPNANINESAFVKKLNSISDTDALYNDWKAVGNDMDWVMKKYENSLERKND